MDGMHVSASSIGAVIDQVEIAVEDMKRRKLPTPILVLTSFYAQTQTDGSGSMERTRHFNIEDGGIASKAAQIITRSIRHFATVSSDAVFTQVFLHFVIKFISSSPHQDAAGNGATTKSTARKGCHSPGVQEGCFGFSLMYLLGFIKRRPPSEKGVARAKAVEAESAEVEWTRPKDTVLRNALNGTGSEANQALYIHPLLTQGLLELARKATVTRSEAVAAIQAIAAAAGGRRILIVSTNSKDRAATEGDDTATNASTVKPEDKVHVHAAAGEGRLGEEPLAICLQENPDPATPGHWVFMQPSGLAKGVEFFTGTLSDRVICSLCFQDFEGRNIPGHDDPRKGKPCAIEMEYQYMPPRAHWEYRPSLLSFGVAAAFKPDREGILRVDTWDITADFDPEHWAPNAQSRATDDLMPRRNLTLRESSHASGDGGIGGLVNGLLGLLQRYVPQNRPEPEYAQCYQPSEGPNDGALCDQCDAPGPTTAWNCLQLAHITYFCTACSKPAACKINVWAYDGRRNLFRLIQDYLAVLPVIPQVGGAGTKSRYTPGGHTIEHLETVCSDTLQIGVKVRGWKESLVTLCFMDSAKHCHPQNGPVPNDGENLAAALLREIYDYRRFAVHKIGTRDPRGYNTAGTCGYMHFLKREGLYGCTAATPSAVARESYDPMKGGALSMSFVRYANLTETGELGNCTDFRSQYPYILGSHTVMRHHPTCLWRSGPSKIPVLRDHYSARISGHWPDAAPGRKRAINPFTWARTDEHGNVTMKMDWAPVDGMIEFVRTIKAAVRAGFVVTTTHAIMGCADCNALEDQHAVCPNCRPCQSSMELVELRDKTECIAEKNYLKALSNSLVGKTGQDNTDRSTKTKIGRWKDFGKKEQDRITRLLAIRRAYMDIVKCNEIDPITGLPTKDHYVKIHEIPEHIKYNSPLWMNASTVSAGRLYTYEYAIRVLDTIPGSRLLHFNVDSFTIAAPQNVYPQLHALCISDRTKIEAHRITEYGAKGAKAYAYVHEGGVVAKFSGHDIAEHDKPNVGTQFLRHLKYETHGTIAYEFGRHTRLAVMVNSSTRETQRTHTHGTMTL